MFVRATALQVDDVQKRQLESMARAGITPQKTARKCEVILLASQGVSNYSIAQRTGLSRPTILAARVAFTQRGIEGIRQSKKRKRSRRALTPEVEQKILDTTLKTRPANATHWSVRVLAAKLGVSRMMVQRVWQHYDIQPHRVEKFKISKDPNFEEKVRDVVGLYMNPPDRALVLCVDEKSQIQALDRTAPLLPLRPGLPERQTHDYKRHGTTTLFAAFNILNGKVIGTCQQRHRSREFVKFLNHLESELPRKRRCILLLMAELKYRGRVITNENIVCIKELIAAHPRESRRRLSQKLCEAWQWKQPNGALRDMVCRGLLLTLDRAGQIELPPVRYVPHNPLARRVQPAPVLIDRTPVEGRLGQFQPLEFAQVRRSGDEPLFNSLLEEHHYLGYEQPVGEHLKYLVWAQGRPLACVAWSSAPRHIGARDRYIGWNQEVRRRNIRLIAYNTRFLILPWVRIPHLASHILGRMATQISPDWQRMYGHPIYFLETFVDPERFRGTCYRAANWVLLGQTTGRGKQSNSYVPNRSLKQVLGYPLTPRFREYLTQL